MKTLLRNFLINLVALVGTSSVLPGLVFSDGARGMVVGSLAFMIASFILVPFLKIILLPLNLLTLGLFAWLSNVLALFVLVNFVPAIKLFPYSFPGANLDGFIVPSMELSTFQVAIVASFIIGLITHFLHWLSR